MRITLFDYGAGNLHSLAKALRGEGRDVRFETDARAALQTDVLVLPGVGAFEPAARALEPGRDAMRDAIADGLPCLGICLGMQLAVIEYARHKAGLTEANSTEFNPDTPQPVVALITEWLDRDGKVERRDASSDLGGTMRLGAQPADIVPGTLVQHIYQSDVVNERHRHRYEFNNAYREKFEKAGFVFSGLSPDGKLVEVIELKDHPFFIASQFHPEFLSKPHQPHPLFKGFIAAVHARLHQKPL